jgi:hypothetical protein
MNLSLNLKVISHTDFQPLCLKCTLDSFLKYYKVDHMGGFSRYIRKGMRKGVFYKMSHDRSTLFEYKSAMKLPNSGISKRCKEIICNANSRHESEQCPGVGLLDQNMKLSIEASDFVNAASEDVVDILESAINHLNSDNYDEDDQQLECEIAELREPAEIKEQIDESGMKCSECFDFESIRKELLHVSKHLKQFDEPLTITISGRKWKPSMSAARIDRIKDFKRRWENIKEIKACHLKYHNTIITGIEECMETPDAAYDICKRMVNDLSQFELVKPVFNEVKAIEKSDREIYDDILKEAGSCHTDSGIVEESVKVQLTWLDFYLLSLNDDMSRHNETVKFLKWKQESDDICFIEEAAANAAILIRDSGSESDASDTSYSTNRSDITNYSCVSQVSDKAYLAAKKFLGKDFIIDEVRERKLKKIKNKFYPLKKVKKKEFERVLYKIQFNLKKGMNQRRVKNAGNDRELQNKKIILESDYIGSFKTFKQRGSSFILKTLIKGGIVVELEKGKLITPNDLPTTISYGKTTYHYGMIGWDQLLTNAKLYKSFKKFCNLVNLGYTSVHELVKLIAKPKRFDDRVHINSDSKLNNPLMKKVMSLIKKLQHLDREYRLHDIREMGYDEDD